jgi:transcriptional regulator GlxA family with amidase domain
VISTAVLSPRGAASIGTSGLLDALIKADRSWRLETGSAWAPIFDVALVGLDSGPVACRDGVFLRPPRTADGVHPDLVIIPALDDQEHEASFAANQPWVPWIQKWHRDGARLASSCTGAFLVAAAGVLDGRRATTHWLFADLFRQWFPQVQLVEEELIVDVGDTISSGGATAFLTLVLYLLERYGGHERAALAAKVLLVDGHRRSQLPFIGFSADRNHDDALVREIQNHIDAHLTERLESDDLARRFALSPRSLTRRFRSATGRTSQAYIRHARIKRAKLLLETTADPIGRIRDEAGYADPAAFRRAFRQEAGISPTDYRAMYGMPSTTPSSS